MPAVAPPANDTHAPWKLYLSLRGRLSRRDFWLFGVLGLAALALFGTALLDIAQLAPQQAEAIVDLLLFWPLLAVSVKRWHDRDRSGWWVLVLLLPLVGWLWALLDNGFVRGTAGTNRFGAAPPRSGHQ